MLVVKGDIMIKRSNKAIALLLCTLIGAVPVKASAEENANAETVKNEIIDNEVLKDNIKSDSTINYNNKKQAGSAEVSSEANNIVKNKVNSEAVNKEEDDTEGQYNVGWVKNSNGTYNLYDGLGNMVKSSWCKVGGKWYYLKDDGTMATGWVKDGGAYYYVGQWGNMHTGWIKDGGLWYYLNDDGIMQKGWVYINGAWYYFNEYGAMVSNDVIDGYTLGSDGRCQ